MHLQALLPLNSLFNRYLLHDTPGKANVKWPAVMFTVLKIHLEMSQLCVLAVLRELCHCTQLV